VKIIVLDVESTGKEKAVDQIIELCLQFGIEAGAESRTWRIKPTIPIHPEATSVHGIKMEDVANCPGFAEVSAEFRPLLEGADVLVGYNVIFDIDMIQAEFTRINLPPLNLAGKHIVDALRFWHHVEPRTLAAAHEKFCGEPFTDAHQAAADVAATARVLTAMLEKFGLAGKEWSEIALVSDPFASRTSWLGPSFHVQWNESNDVVFMFGKNKGTKVEHADVGFLRWILRNDFPPHVKKICMVVLERPNEFKAWIATYYPRPALPPAAKGAPL